LTYHWLAWVLSAFIVQLPFTFLSSLTYWLLWSFAVGYFYAPSRAGYSFLMYELFEVFATSLAQLCASLIPNIEAAFAAKLTDSSSCSATPSREHFRQSR
jgi:ABC-type multidrug transport system permease subunit